MHKFLFFICVICLAATGFSCGGGSSSGSSTPFDLTLVADDTNTGASSISNSVYVTTYTELTSAVSSASSGTNIVINSSSLSCNSQLVLSKENANITIQAGTGYSPVLDFSAMGSLTGDSGAGINIKGSYYTIKGLTIKNAPTKGMIIKSAMGKTNTARFNKIENCVFCYNGDAGLSISTGVSSGCTNDGSIAAVNYIKNCDSYMNCDLAGSTGAGGNADGFACKLDPGTGNAYYGCRSWNNGDDGWDLYNCNYKVVITNCWTWHNGDGSLWTGWTTWGGNGNGFKTGGASCNGNIIVKNCVAFDNIYGSGSTTKGFDQNHQSGTVTLTGNLAFNNDLDYGWTDKTGTVILSGSNYTIGGTATFSCKVTGSTTNAASADFYSILASDAVAARQSDGSLPVLASGYSFGQHK